MRVLPNEIPDECFLPDQPSPDSIWMKLPLDELRGMAEYQSAKALALADMCGVEPPKE